ncbi:hypothetical protein QL093DRAFT_2215918 [Fusarium oxysporum]|nr:hypothetical protein QL093DRAFT_2215918 [Fusarium oxysporum]
MGLCWHNSCSGYHHHFSANGHSSGVSRLGESRCISGPCLICHSRGLRCINYQFWIPSCSVRGFMSH